MKRYLAQLKNFDLYPKTVEEAKEKSSAGAIVSIVGFSILALLALSEVSAYWQVTKENSLSVYTNRDERLPINFRMTFFELPCEAINIDVTDRYGEEMLSAVDIGKNLHVVKQSWKGDFTEVEAQVEQSGWGVRSVYDKQLKLWNGLWKNTLPKRESRNCLPCYEAGKRANQCCNNCYELKMAYLVAGLHVEAASRLPQCQETPEGCLVSGYARVNKVQGGFHIAVGQSHTEGGQRHHHHWDAPLRPLGFNSTHYIHHFSFGSEFPGMVNPLDGVSYVEKGIGQQQYFLQVVPTVYAKTNGAKILTNQYSVTENYNPIDINAEHIELPGVFFKYDISPIMINMEEKRQSLAHLITRVFAIVGGVWVVLGVAYKSLTNLVNKLLNVVNSL